MKCRTPAPWRASLLALGCAAAPKPVNRGRSERPPSPGQGALRTPAGASSLRHRPMGATALITWDEVPNTCPVASELARAGLCSSPKAGKPGRSERPPSPGQGALRTPAGASSLATGAFTFDCVARHYTALSSRPRSSMFGMAIAAASPSSETPALTINKCLKVSSNSPRKASCASPGAAFNPSRSTFPE